MAEHIWHNGGRPWGVPLLFSLGIHLLGLCLAGVLFDLEVHLPQPPAPIKVGLVFKPRPAPPPPPTAAPTVAPALAKPPPEPVPQPRLAPPKPAPVQVKKPPPPPARKPEPARVTTPDKTTPATPATTFPDSESLPITVAASTSPAPPAEEASTPRPRDAAPPPLTERPAYRHYLGEVHLEIDRHKRYPLMARRGGQQGVALVDFQLDEQGRLCRCVLATSSGFRLLDQAALKAVRAAAPFSALPEGLGGRLELRVPIRFELHH